MLKTVGVGLFERQKPSKINIFINCVLVLLVILIGFELFFNSRFTSILVDGDSMLPTLTGENEGVQGDYIFADSKLTPTYGDIVVVEPRPGYNIIKRVVAFGGDTVKIERGILKIKYAGSSSFTEIQEDYLNPKNNDPEKLINNFSEHLVGEGRIFLLGDNRNISSDSRANGDYEIDDIVGVVPRWALKNKSVITSVFAFLKHTLPRAFGFKS